MADVSGFIWAGLAGGGLSAALLAVAAVLGKSQLAHWLNKDIENIKAQHQRELEADKAKYARELESYRTSLISQVESQKAEYEIKKQFALRVHEMRFKNIEILHSACTLITADLMYFTTTPPEERTEQDKLKIGKTLDDIYESMMRLTMFLDKQEMLAIANLNKFLRTEANKNYQFSGEVLDKIKSECQSHIAPVHKILTTHLTRMMILD